MKKNVTILFAVLSVACMNSCSSKSDDEIGDIGFFISFQHRPSEVATVSCSGFDINDSQETIPMVDVNVTSSLKERIGYTTLGVYTTEGDTKVEQQIAELLDPGHDIFRGHIPVPIEYRTEVCKSFRILLCDINGDVITDMTDIAIFGQIQIPHGLVDIGGGFIINSERQLLGKIPIGLTIGEYLSHCPMIFASAHFLFPTLDKSLLTPNCYVKIEIEFENGIELEASTQGRSNRRDFR